MTIYDILLRRSKEMTWEKTSRKFRLMLYDMAIALILLIGGRVLTPDDMDMVIALIGIIQPVFLAIILGTAWEDAALKRGGGGVG